MRVGVVSTSLPSGLFASGRLGSLESFVERGKGRGGFCVAGSVFGQEEMAEPGVPPVQQGPDENAELKVKIKAAFNIFDKEEKLTCDVREIGTILRLVSSSPLVARGWEAGRTGGQRWRAAENLERPDRDFFGHAARLTAFIIPAHPEAPKSGDALQVLMCFL